MATMGLEGMEIIAIAVVVGLFIVVLKQFGIWEPLSLEGKTRRAGLKRRENTTDNLCSIRNVTSFIVLCVMAKLKFSVCDCKIEKGWKTLHTMHYGGLVCMNHHSCFK